MTSERKNEWRECGCFVFHRTSYRGTKFRYWQYWRAFKLSGWSFATGTKRVKRRRTNDSRTK